MSDPDDPFGLAGDPGRTRIRPLRPPAPETRMPGMDAPERPAVEDRAAEPETPGPGQPAWQPGGAEDPWRVAPQPPRQDAPRPAANIPRPHPNPLIAGQAPLLEIAPELEQAQPAVAVETLRLRLQQLLASGRAATQAAGVAAPRADQAAWFVAALVDDIALNTPWGGHSGWPRETLVTALSGEVDAGTRFFTRLEALMAEPGRDPELLELAGLCLALGFRGKHRVQAGGGEAELEALRLRIARALRQDEAGARPLSPQWQGVDAPDEPRRVIIPAWTVALAALALVGALYTALAFQLSDRTGQLFALAEALPPADRAAIYRPVRDTGAPAAPPVADPAVSLALLPEFARAAPPALLGALKGQEDVALAILVVQSSAPEVFRSARAELDPAYRPLIAAIAGVIRDNQDVIGRVTVIGHTDSVRVQASNPFASNQGLSEARAQTIAAALVAAGVDPARITAQGRAETEPLADNATREGRAQNRRIEIRIEKRL